MEPTAIGQPAPALRLPSAQGSEIALEDYRGRKNVIVWFTKGMGCPFCRQHMSQLARAYPRIQELGTEVPWVTISKPKHAQMYAQTFRLPFPYLCDPDYRVRREWGLEDQSHSPLWYARTFIANSRIELPPPTE